MRKWVLELFWSCFGASDTRIATVRFRDCRRRSVSVFMVGRGLTVTVHLSNRVWGTDMEGRSPFNVFRRGVIAGKTSGRDCF